MHPQPLHPTSTSAPQRAREAAACRLTERLQDLTSDRVASARATALEAARELHTWALEQPQAWSSEDAARDLEAGWLSWTEQQAWRGCCAQLVDDVRAALRDSASPRAALLAEARTWIDEEQAPVHQSRLVSPERVIPHALRELRREDCILIHGYSELCVKVLGAAQHAGLAPQVSVSEVAADASGKRMARELLAHGVRVKLSRDLAVLAAIEEADQLWFGSEAIGAGLYVGYVGSSLLLERAREAGVPTRVLATASDFVPGGEAELPEWGAFETDSLWCFPPEGVELQAQPFEFVDADGVERWITEAGSELFGDFCMRALRPESASALSS